MTINHRDEYKLNAPSPYVLYPSSSSKHEPSSLLPLLDGYERVESDSYSIFTKQPLEQSPNDDKQYRLIMLSNGLEVLIISDPKSDKSSAAMDVKVGHLSDPKDLQGLAHFCEHLMFMGTEKYPKENDYTEFLTLNSGSSNAFTGMDQTCYFFDCSPESLPLALDRFAQFFISPLFDPNCSEREANAVNSENSKNLQNDMWRMFQLDKSTSNRDSHVYWRFGTGNKRTLWEEPLRKGIDVRQRLIDWCEKHYSSNISKLVVLSKDSLDETTKLVVDQFSPIKNRNLSPPNFKGSPLTEKELGVSLLLNPDRGGILVIWH
jgi:insulysin